MFSEKRIAVGLLVLLFAMQGALLIARADREPHPDELEYLHTSWLMANGGTIFTSFFQHHSPLLFAAIAPLAPQSERADAQPYAERARWVAGLAGLLALAAFACVVANRAGSVAAAIAVAAFFASGPLWLRVIADLRAEPFALAFFFSGVVLVALPKRHVALAAGAGVGLIAIAALWTPKFPLCSAVIGIYALVRARRGWMITVVTAGVLTTAGLLLVNAIAPLETVRFFMLDFSAAANDLSRSMPEFAGKQSFLYARPLFSLPIIGAASLIVIVAAFRDREQRAALLFVALFAAAVLEIRFLHPYPAVWVHNYGLWALAGAAVLGCVPSALRALLPVEKLSGPARRMVFIAPPLLAIIVLLPSIAVQFIFRRGTTSMYWNGQRAMVAQMRPNDTVWITPARHPLTVRDAHYYWFGFDGGFLVVAAQLRRNERGRRYLPPLEPLPLCAALRGESDLRFASAPRRIPGMESEVSCFATLRSSGRARPIAVPGIFEILPAH